MNEEKDPHDGEYVGNIFGPQVTFWGAVILLFFITIAVYRHWALGIPFGMEPVDATTIDTLRDTIIRPQ